ncbi:MAG: TonB-dependent receptor [Candidatus Marinimicrobia bacterium]|nr:TonB-dependent receptor [Candidatus Neomarinimicrobiota bacterium]MCF7840817.1 TonB-dependent receptor [Candidatus Neomarinimicrobiota bacterium]MCF7903207.1 TonB-dependent receptor [Candidatus Neomarinimicrobiota bacterium]
MTIKPSGLVPILFALLTGISVLAAEHPTPVEFRQINGSITDQHGRPLPFANIQLPELNRGAVADDLGRFHLRNVPPGNYVLVASYIGYSTEKVTVDVRHSDLNINLTLRETLLTMPGVTVTAESQAKDILNTPQTVSLMGEMALARSRDQSLAMTLHHIPGVQAISQGPAVAKPMIRGLTNQRVLILKDGVRQEGQQWSDHHTPELDIFDAGQVEVVRGPGSLLYGSDALGGVINVISPEPRTLPDGGKPFSGKFSLQTYTNNAQVSGNLALSGAGVQTTWGFSLSGRQADNLSVPDDDLFLKNVYFTGYRQWQAKAFGTWNREVLRLRMQASRFYEEQTLLGEGHWHNTSGPDGGPWFHPGAAIYSPTYHDRIQLNGQYFADEHHVKFALAFQNNHRQGIPEGQSPQIDITTRTWTLNLNLHRYHAGRFGGSYGVSLEQKTDGTHGPEPLIPNAETQSVGVFTQQTYEFRDWHLSAGGRVDGRQINVRATRFTTDYLVPDTTLTYWPVYSGAVGAVWHPEQEPFAVALNLGTAWRAPTPSELFMRGVHHATYRFEYGDPDLTPELAYNTDLSLRWSSCCFNGAAALFHNTIHHYINANPTGEYDATTNIPIYQIRQADARIMGLEVSGEAMLGRIISITGSFDLVRGEHFGDVMDADEDGKVESWLPQMPADRLQVGGGIHLADWRYVRKPEFYLEMSHYAAQNRLAEFENVLNRDADMDGHQDVFESAGYTLLSASFSGKIPVARQIVELQVRANNLLNATYTSHLSNYKGLILNPGLDVVVGITMKF